MDSGDSNNGGGNGRGREMVDTVVLTYDRLADKLEVGGQAASLDLMLDMLGRATRAVEHQLRQQQVMQMRQAMADQALTETVRKTIQQ